MANRDANLGRDDCELVGKTGQGASESHVELFESSLAAPSLAWILLRPFSVEIGAYSAYCVYVGTFTGQQYSEILFIFLENKIRGLHGKGFF